MIRASLLVAGFVATTATGHTPAQNNQTQATTANRTVSHVQPTSAEDTAAGLNLPELDEQFHGVARPSQIVDLPPLVSGTIKELHVQEGQVVRKGQPLVTMDDRIPRARLLAATVEANLTGGLKRAQVQRKMAESRLKRIRNALSQGAGADFELEAAEGERDQSVAAVEQQEDILKAAEADRQLAEAQLAQYTIVAPFDGVITEIHVKSGAVDPSFNVITMANFNALEVEMHVPSSMFGTLRSGQTLSLNAARPVSRNIDARIVSVSPIINSASETFRCLLRIDNSNIRLPAGFTVVLNDGPTLPSPRTASNR